MGPLTVPDAVLARLTTAATRVLGSLGLELFDLQFRREPIGWVLRVIIDRPAGTGNSGSPGDPGGPAPPEEPVGINDCRRVSEDLSTLLDVEEELTAGIDQAYTLEVSSPGLDRPLRGETDYRRFTGRLAKIVTREPVLGQSHFAGRLSGIEGEDLLLTEGRRVHRVPLAVIRRARLEVEF
jgi:ribosome maturation factor RimP